MSGLSFSQLAQKARQDFDDAATKLEAELKKPEHEFDLKMATILLSRSLSALRQYYYFSGRAASF